jgi:hypothetical protein
MLGKAILMKFSGSNLIDFPKTPKPLEFEDAMSLNLADLTGHALFRGHRHKVLLVCVAVGVLEHVWDLSSQLGVNHVLEGRALQGPVEVLLLDLNAALAVVVKQ